MEYSDFNANSRYFNFKEALTHNSRNVRQHVDAISDELFNGIAERITEALHLFPECRHLSVEYRNILAREHNPEGFNGFFRIKNAFEESIDARVHAGRVKQGYEGFGFPPKEVNVPSQPGDTQNVRNVPE